jgi:hypothetical protein
MVEAQTGSILITSGSAQSEVRRLAFWRRRGHTANHEHRIRFIAESAGTAVLAILLYLILGEAAIRIALKVPIFELRDFRHERAAATINKLIQYDSSLGWRLKAHISGEGFNTLEYGFRSNDGTHTPIKPGGVLAVGSSYTAGSGVIDNETWPAHLQRITGWNVNNAGQGGFQADQIILLGAQLLPLVRPQVIVVDLIPGTIIGTGNASYGWPNPYFTVADGRLVAHNAPVPEKATSTRGAFDLRHLLGHFATVHKFMEAFFPDRWFTADGNDFRTVATDEITVTCTLLEDLKRKAGANGTRVLLYLQYGGLEIIDGNRMRSGGRLDRLVRPIKNWLKARLLNLPPGAPTWDEASSRVGECARQLDIPVIDEFAPLMAAYQADPGNLRAHYQTEPNGSMGHKSSFGNLEVAKRVAAAIGKIGPP